MYKPNYLNQPNLINFLFLVKNNSKKVDKKENIEVMKSLKSIVRSIDFVVIIKIIISIFVFRFIISIISFCSCSCSFCCR